MLKKILLLIISSCLLSGCFLEEKRPADYYYIPEGYIGRIKITYKVKSSPPVNIINGKRKFIFNKNGVMNTSSPFFTGIANDKYFYYKNGRLKELPYEPDGNALGIRGVVIGGTTKPPRINVQFYVGSFKQYEKRKSEF